MDSIDPDNAFVANGTGAWGSPAFLRSSRSSYGETIDSAYDPFIEEDGFVRGKGRKRPRYSLRREEWRVLDEPESPRELEREETVDWDRALDEDMELEQDTVSVADVEPSEEPSDHVGPTAQKMVTDEDPFIETSGGFVKPSLGLAGGLFGRRASPANNVFENASASPTPAAHLPTDTPQLRPIPSPGLPIPSPIVSDQNNSQGYFSPFHAVPQAEDAQSLSIDVTIDASNQGTPHGLAIPMAMENAENQGLDFNQGDISVHQIVTSMQDHDQDLPNNADISTSPVKLLDSIAPEHADLSRMAASDVEAGHIHEVDELSATEELQDHTMPQLEAEENTGTVPTYEKERSSPRSVPIADTMFKDLGSRIQAPIGLTGGERGIHTLLGVETPDQISSVTSPERSERYEPQLDVDGEISEMQSDAGSDAEEGIFAEEVDDDHDGSRDAYYEDEDEYEAYSDEEHYDDDDGEEDEEEESETDNLPPRPQAPPEVIVLDSDSEDELASDQVHAPPPPSRPDQARRPEISSPAERTLSLLAGLDNEEEWSGIEEDAAYDEMESAESEGDKEQNFDEDDRVHDSDLNDDESSVDVLARTESVFQQSTAEPSVEPEHDYDEVDDEESEVDAAEEMEDYSEAEPENEPDDGFEAIERQQQIIDIDSGSDEAEEAREEIGEEVGEEVEEEVEVEVEAQPEEIHGEAQVEAEEAAERSSVDPTSLSQTEHEELHHGMDGTDDKHTPPSSHIEPAQQTTNNDHQYSEVQPEYLQRELRNKDSIDESLGSVLDTTGQQLPTPAPTQGSLTAPLGTHDISIPLTATPQSVELHTPAPDPYLQPGQLLGEEQIAPDTLPGTENDGLEDKMQTPETPKVLVTSPRAPDRHALGLRSKLSYFAPLATLIDHYNALVDTIAIVHEATPIAKAASASKDFFITLQLTDPSMAGTTLQAQIFRRRKSVMPSVVPGNAILLRDFKVRSYDHSIMLVSVESSSWAVFDGIGPNAQMNGPPVEYGSEERACASDLRTWYNEHGIHMLADNELQAAIERDSMGRELSPGSAVPSETGSFESGSRSMRRSRNSHRRVTIHELRDGTRYTEVGSPSTKDSIHELRDGTVYATR